MKRIMLIAMTLVIGIAFAMPRGTAAPMQKGKGGGGGNKTTVVLKMTLHDEHPGTRLLSDGLLRGPDGADVDSIGDLSGPFVGIPIDYQDSRISEDEPGATFPDPCSQIDETRAQFDPQACSQSDPDFTDDIRTYSLIFESFGGDGAGCACDEFAYLNDSAGMLGGADPATGFTDSRDVNTGVGTCRLDIAAGAIVTDTSQSNTAVQQIVAAPYASAPKPKGKKGGTPGPAMTNVNFNFHADVDEPGADRNYQLISQGANFEAINPDMPDDTGARTVIATGASDELFDLRHPANEPMCFNIPMLFKISYQRYEVPSQ